jgi:hypothetical protein
MEWVTILTTLLPLILKIIEKPTNTPEGKNEMLAIGNDMLALGISADVPLMRLAGQYVICAAKSDEAGKAKLMALAEGVDRMAKASAARQGA